MRRITSLILLAAIAPGTLVRQAAVPPSLDPRLTFTAIPLPSQKLLARHLGPFRLEGVWQMHSRHQRFGSYSALLALGQGRLLAVSDRGDTLHFSPPGGGTAPRPVFGTLLRKAGQYKPLQDAESATRDPLSGTVWIGWEHVNAISRHSPALVRRRIVMPAAMRGWSGNSGAEAMVRLRDGRFAVLAEAFAGSQAEGAHPGVLFSGDPTMKGRAARFVFQGTPRFSPTDMAQLPDGRVLVLMRRLVWPFPLRFSGRLVVADPADLKPGGVWHGREVARLTSTLPVDNFEGLAIAPRADGRVTVWLISDDNDAVTQRTLLWKLVL